MNRLAVLAAWLERYPGWSSVGESDLALLISAELGSRDPFGEGVRLARIRRVARRPARALLVCAGTLPHSAWQALARLVLVETEEIFVKLPAAPCADVIADSARALQAAGLVRRVTTSRDLPQDGLRAYPLVIVFGSAETVETFRATVPWHSRFLAFGHKISLAVVHREDVHLETARGLVADVLTNAQQGCLAPHVCYVDGPDHGLMAAFCARAFAQHFSAKEPPKWTHEAAAAIFTRRQAESALGSEVLTPEDGSLAWTVVACAGEEFEPAPAHNFLLVKKFSGADHLRALLAPASGMISTVALSPHQQLIEGLGASRYCPIGRMQQPSLYWTQDGYLPLAEMVTWISIEDKDKV